ncbi:MULTISPECIES: 23S rRNA (uracil(1939)-C(5))-methyltransferase RlmD [Vibrio]|uniref:23S rRNA (uracil(1939)-C(5))-methyltransferase RlmD n=1 Tax=Vibrio algicola TaxID=2662262 RepID=A0A5Q0TE22_9VIBR|nr:MULTISPECIES: 23S rRNA (uracil(1939)-C(5))-methyltransferase RlmD [Vibrio]MBD1575152.1 23S rRNA (uracil(1939)-C(5))-methyltransferase RlmD [Vibrio sp. S11_S32]
MANFYQTKKPQASRAQHQLVTIERLDHQGAGIAYQNKKPIFVEGTLPSERVLVQMVEEKSKFSKAKLIKVEQASTQRIDAFCPHYQECGGCNLQHLSHDDQIAHKAQSLTQLMTKFAGKALKNSMENQGELPLAAPIIANDTGYRRRARISLMFDIKTQSLQFGFRQKSSKNIVNVTDCPVLEPQLNALLPSIKALLDTLEQPRKLGHVEVVFDGTNKAMLLRHTAALTAQEHQSLVDFAKHNALTLYLSPNQGELDCVVGEALVCQETGSKIAFLPNDFIQVNQNVNQAMVEQAVDWLGLTSQDRVLDLFSGLGNFSFSMAKQAEHVVGIEGVEAMVQRATENAKLNNIENVEFYQADLEQDLLQAPWAKKQFNKVLLDPARAGASGIIERIASLGAQAVVYVSCNPATLARDSQNLLNQGYELHKLGMLDMFPHTSHLESMALFIKTGKVKKNTTKKPVKFKL